MCFLAVLIAYTDRVNISVASVAMREQFGWTQTVKGFVLSSFFIGYMLFMVASGWLATRFGGKRVLAISVVCWSVFTLLTPWAASISVATLLAVRIGLGVGEAAIVPATYELLRRWAPESERSRAVTGFNSGGPFGQIVGFLVTGWLTGRFGWPKSFYLFGVIGFIWAAFWLARIHDNPADDRRISAPELRLLQGSRGVDPEASGPPIRTLLARAPVWAIFISQFSNNWGLYLLMAWLPSYFRDTMKLSIANAAEFAAAPWLATFIAANAAAALSDGAIARGIATAVVRKITVGLGLLGFSACLLLLLQAHSQTSALLVVCAATGSLGISWSGFTPNMLDIAPRHSAVLMGVSNTLATIPGIAGVTITGWLLDKTGGYSATFVLTAALGIMGALVYLICGSARRIDG